jgi:hypothetical protein
MDSATFQAEIATLLHEREAGTAAEFNDRTIAFWNGIEARGARFDEQGQLAGEFELDDRECNRLHVDLISWMERPRYSMRPELLKLMLANLPPAHTSAHEVTHVEI